MALHLMSRTFRRLISLIVLIFLSIIVYEHKDELINKHSAYSEQVDSTHREIASQ
jgi:hypothetical protein